jgi:hypothetical protein
MSAFASFPFELPAGLKFDGVQEVGAVRLLQFTEIDPQAGPSLGATFYVEAAQALQAEIAKRREEVRQKFRIAKTEPERPDKSPLEVESAEASEGPEREGNKPLMRNPTRYERTPIGHAKGDTFPSSPEQIGAA